MLYNTNQIQADLTQFYIQQQNAYNMLLMVLNTQASAVYSGDTPDEIAANAQAWVAAMGTNAVQMFENSSALVDFINQLAAINNQPTISNPLPSYLAFVPNADGSGVLTYTPPASSSSSSSSAG